MYKSVNVTIPNGQALSEAIDMRNWVPGSAGLVGIGPAWTSAVLGFQASQAADGPFSPVRDQAGSLVQVSGIQTAASGWYVLPAELSGAPFVKLWSCTSGGADTNQGADRGIAVAIKG